MKDSSTLEYVDSPGALADWIEHLKSADSIAVDTQSDSFHHYQEKVCLIQMTTMGRDAVIDPLELGDIEPLAEIFADPTKPTIFHDADYDLRALKRDFGFEITGLIDTMLASRLLGKRKFGLAFILEERFGFVAEKQYQRSNWAHRPLSEGQLHYARSHTHYLPQIADELRRALEEMGRWNWVLEDSARLLKMVGEPTARGTEIDPDGFWRVKGLRGLSSLEVGRVKVLYLVREQIAQRLDRPPFKVFNDNVIIDIVKNPPGEMSDFSPRPGLQQSGVVDFGEEILSALKEAKSIKNAPPPGVRRRRRSSRFQDPKAKQRYQDLRELRGELAEDLGIEPDVLANNAVLEEFARKPPSAVEDLAQHEKLAGWRIPIMAEAIYKRLQPKG